MLHRAASNAYSWWWASHIRTKQSKWLDSNLVEMEDRVKSMLKLIEGDADSFGKRAELYFKSRPELTSLVEETYRAYRSLAERYDHISGELHKANHTIATAFPDQVQYAMLEEEDENYPKAITPIDARKIHKSTVESLMIKRKEDQSAIKKRQHRTHASQIDKDKAPEEINRLQKGILVLQTEKEFIKSSYESGIAKYWEIEKKIAEMHDDVCYLQDEFSTSAVIDDDEARALMTAAALKSCEDAIVDLHEQRKKSKEQARIESGRIRIAEGKLKVLKGEDGQCKLETTTEIADGNKEMSSTSVSMEEEVHSLKQERLELQEICEKVKDHFHMNSDTSVGEIVEKVDEIVNKIVDLELKVSSQTAQINTLSLENNELEKTLQSLEEDKMVLTNNSTDLSDRLEQAGEELKKVQILEQTVQDEETTLCADFSDACHSLNAISEKLLSHKHQEQVDDTNPFIEEPISLCNIEPQRECKGEEGAQSQDMEENSVEKTHGIQELGCNTKDHGQPEAVSQIENHSEKNHDLKQKVENYSSQVDASIQVQLQTLLGEQEGALDLQQLLSNGLEDREKILLAEYTSVLRNYKETKKRLLEVEKKNHEYVCETAAIIRELTNVNAMKDKEIQSLQQCLGSPEMSSNGLAGANSAEAEDLRRGHHRLKSMAHLPTLVKENSNLPNSGNPFVDVQSSAKLDTLTEAEDRVSPDVEGMMLEHLDEPEFTSFIEEKFRRDIDALLEENLEFWLKFSTSFHRIQEFQTTLKGLQDEIEKLKESKMQEGINSAVADQVVRGESEPIDRHLRALKTDLQVWLEQNAHLRGELQCRFSSLCGIQEEISGALKESSETEGAQFTPYQAAKFQGEVLNMQQENNKVASELQAGLDHVRGLQAEIEKALSKLHEDFELSGFKSGQHPNLRHISSKTRVPLQSFLFGTKPKRTSIFSRMNPAFQKQHRDFRPGFPR